MKKVLFYNPPKNSYTDKQLEAQYTQVIAANEQAN